MTIIYVGAKVVDIGVNEDAWENPNSWLYGAKATLIGYGHTPPQPLNTPLYNISCSCTVMRAQTVYEPGSTSFPGSLGNKRVWVKVEIYIQFIRPETFFVTVTANDFDVQVVRIN